jgi:tetratricopeptide (TPR) repeat protein
MRTLFLRLAFAGLIGAAMLAPAARAAESPSVPNEPAELPPVRAMIKAKQYAPALAQLKVLVVKYPTPDVYTLLGHALWKTGDPAQGMAYYNKALATNPNHRGALEYQGELFVEQGQLDKAKENLTRLNHLCVFGCEEASDLKAAIEHAPRRS